MILRNHFVVKSRDVMENMPEICVLLDPVTLVHNKVKLMLCNSNSLESRTSQFCSS